MRTIILAAFAVAVPLAAASPAFAFCPITGDLAEFSACQQAERQQRQYEQQLDRIERSQQQIQRQLNNGRQSRWLQPLQY